MSKRVLRLAICAVLVVSASVAVADWKPEDGSKMHYPQLPDVDNGMNVWVREPKILADDWLCTGSGWVTDIHIWVSWLNDGPSPVGLHLDTYIFKDVPAHQEPTGAPVPSMPGELLWARHFGAADVVVNPWAQHTEPFYDPNENLIIGFDTQILQLNLFIHETEAFWQTQGQIYWLGIQSRVLTQSDNAVLGWKSSADHWNDDAVWGDFSPDPAFFPGMQLPGSPVLWNELIDPRNGKSMDLSFVITGVPEPATVMLTVLGAGMLLGLRRRRRK